MDMYCYSTIISAIGFLGRFFTLEVIFGRSPIIRFGVYRINFKTYTLPCNVFQI